MIKKKTKKVTKKNVKKTTKKTSKNLDKKPAKKIVKKKPLKKIVKKKDKACWVLHVVWLPCKQKQNKTFGVLHVFNSECGSCSLRVWRRSI